MRVCLITGAASGLGKAISALLVLSLRGEHAFPFDIVVEVDKKFENNSYSRGAVCMDVTCDKDWQDLRDEVEENCDTVSCIINCCGVNSIAYLEDFEESEWDRLLDTNAKSIFLSSKAFISHLEDTVGVIVNITSNASHMPMTSSLAYNASKAAAHIMTQQLARELTKRKQITVFGVAPNKMSGTEMSAYIEDAVPKVRGWTKEQAAQYQQASLMAGETPPHVVADFIVFLLSSRERFKHLTGCIIPYGA